MRAHEDEGRVAAAAAFIARLLFAIRVALYCGELCVARRRLAFACALKARVRGLKKSESPQCESARYDSFTVGSALA